MAHRNPQHATGSPGVEPSVLVSVKEAARLLDVAPATAYKMCDTLELASIYVRTSRKVLRASIDDYIRRQIQDGAA